MEAPAFSCSTEAHSNTLIVDSDDEVDQSSTWIQQEDHTSSDLPPDFLEPLSPGAEAISPLPPLAHPTTRQEQQKSTHENRQFWKSGDFTGFRDGASFATEGMDHARVHPKFLHSNATSHKWVLGAIAELLDNAVDEIRNGATFAKVDVQKDPRNGEPMLVIEDDGGGMDPECMRRCMSLGYSAKSKLSNTIGQYGNGFKTSTMRLGADVIVFSRYGGSKPSESIGMMSYTFLTSTGQNDIIVPIVDFQTEAFGIRKLIRSNVEDWMESMEAIENWSPYSSQAELVNQFKSMPRRQGTKIVIYNLWEDEEGRLELDFAADPHDIQIRSTTRDEKTLKLAARYASCRHYLIYKHSLRTYLSILYLRLPVKFRIFLRGKQVQHHCLRNEMMFVEQVTYKPKDAGNAKAVVTLGFVKDAGEHIDVSGFNVYHKNRLIKPFWRIWNPSDTRGRGIIAILEANFVEPAHDKQGFERTIVLTRLEARLIEMQKSHWKKHCHKIGYTNASMRKTVRTPPHDNNSPASGGVNSSPANGRATKRAMLPVSERAVADVHNGGVASNISHIEDISPAVMKQTSLNSSILEVQEPNVVLGCIDSVATGVENSNKSMLHSQDPVQIDPGRIRTAQFVHDPPLTSLRRDLQMSFSPISSDVTNSHVHSTCLSPTDVNLQELCPQFSRGMAPVFIDLDSPDVDEKFEDVAFEVPFPPNCDVKKEITEEVDLESRFLSEAGNNLETSLPGVDLAGLPKGIDSEGLADPLLSFSPSGEMNALPESVGLESSSVLPKGVGLERCSVLPESVGLESCSVFPENVGSVNCSVLPESVGLESCSVDDVTWTDQVEASFKEHDMESHGQSDDLVVPAIKGCLAAPITIVKEGPKLENETFGKEVPENGSVEFPSSNRSSTTCSEPQILTVMELDDFFDSLVPQNEAPSHTPLSNKEREAFAQSHIIEIDLIEAKLTENATPDNDCVPFSASIDILIENKSIVSNEKSEGASKEHRNRDVDKLQFISEDARKGCNKGETDMNAVMIDAEGQEGEDCKEDLVKIDEKPVSAVREQPTQTDLALVPHIATDQKDIDKSKFISEDAMKDCNKAETDMDAVMIDAEGQEVEDCKADLVKDDEKPVLAVTEQPTHKDLALVPHVATHQKDSCGSIQASCQDIVCISMATITEVVATVDIASSSCIDLMEGERFVLAKQQMEYLQQSIQAVEVEVDDLREQLEQHRELQHLEMRNLGVELERALSRLEELRG